MAAIPRSARRALPPSAFRPNSLRSDDWTLARSRVSPSISEVATASAQIASTVRRSRSGAARCLVAPSARPPPTRKMSSAFLRTALFYWNRGQSGCCQSHLMSDSDLFYRSSYARFVIDWRSCVTSVGGAVAESDLVTHAACWLLALSSSACPARPKSKLCYWPASARGCQEVSSRDLTIAPTSAPASTELIKMPRNQPQARDSGIGMKHSYLVVAPAIYTST